MRYGVVTSAVFVALSVVSQMRGDEPIPGKQVACELSVKGVRADAAEAKTIHYWLFLPADYENKASLPLMVSCTAQASEAGTWNSLRSGAHRRLYKTKPISRSCWSHLSVRAACGGMSI